ALAVHDCPERPPSDDDGVRAARPRGHDPGRPAGRRRDRVAAGGARRDRARTRSDSRGAPRSRSSCRRTAPWPSATPCSRSTGSCACGRGTATSSVAASGTSSASCPRWTRWRHSTSSGFSSRTASRCCATVPAYWRRAWRGPRGKGHRSIREDQAMPARGIHHIDLAVTDVERSLAFYRELLAPLGLEEDGRYQSYRGTEEVVYLRYGDQLLGLRPADGGEHRYYEASSTSRSTSTSRPRWTPPISAASPWGRMSTSRRKRIATSRPITSCSSSIRIVGLQHRILNAGSCRSSASQAMSLSRRGSLAGSSTRPTSSLPRSLFMRRL